MMFKRSTALVLSFFLMFQVAAQVLTINAASAGPSNFYWKSNYNRSAGTVTATATAPCPSGQERGSVLTATYAVASAQAGVSLCYPVCKAGYKGIGTVCYLIPPTGYVDCGAGIASSSLQCAGIIANQVISIGVFSIAVYSLVSTESSTGEDAADLITTSKTAIEEAVKSPKLLYETEQLGKAMVPIAKNTATAMKADLKSFASGVEDGPTFAQRLKTNLEAQGISAASVTALVKKIKVGLLAKNITFRTGSVMYNAVHDTNTSAIDILRDTVAFGSYALAVYELTHPKDKIPASTTMGVIAAFMYPKYGVTY